VQDLLESLLEKGRERAELWYPPYKGNEIASHSKTCHEDGKSNNSNLELQK